MITFQIHGKPFGKQRPRSTRFGRMYTPKETVAFEGVVREVGALHCASPLQGPVRLTITATFQPPPSWSKKKRAAHLGRPHIQKPDADNCAKAIKDGLNRVAWADDCQVADLRVVKVWGEDAHTTVTVEVI